MPRPGPRPYECFRRAWHSDRPQPLRGSLIQEIFRMVNEVHSSSTRKNREWQEKFPIVVLRAEEILYSKANSEAEYSDITTLWNRVNDAIDTIIRRDETTENGELLRPCIEAALHLGCTPRRSSRSQRNDSPRNYLSQSHGQQQPSSVPEAHNQTASSPLMPRCPQFPLLSTVNSSLMTQSSASNSIKKLPISMESFSPRDKRIASSSSSGKCSMDASNTWSVYPLYCNNQVQPSEPSLPLLNPSATNTHLTSSHKLVLQPNFRPFGRDGSGYGFPVNRGHSFKDKQNGVDCDLTLRLGSIVVPGEYNENHQMEMGNAGTFKNYISK